MTDSTGQHDLAPWEDATFEDHAVFRESFLLKLRPEEAAACRLLGRRIYHDHHETVLPDERLDHASWVALDLEGALAELTFLEGYLGDTALAPDEYPLEPDDLALAHLAAEARATVRDLQQRLRSALRSSARPEAPRALALGSRPSPSRSAASPQPSTANAR